MDDEACAALQFSEFPHHAEDRVEPTLLIVAYADGLQGIKKEQGRKCGVNQEKGEADAREHQ